MKKSLSSIGEPTPDVSWIDEPNDAEYKLMKLRLPDGVDVQDAMAYGFYEYKQRYWMRRGEDRFDSVSNFTLRVLYLIEGANPKRIVEIHNVFGKKTTIDFGIEDLISLEKFKLKVESWGNFLFEGKAPDLGKIKAKLFNQEVPAIEIPRLGQYKNLFWVFANGIYDGVSWLPIDDRGMVPYKDKHYFIPVFGSTTADDNEDLRNYRRFLHRESPIGIEEWSNQFVKVYGENGIIGIAFYLFSLFSDFIFDKTKAAPMLFLFGQRGSGKGTMAISLMNLFGFAQDPLMLGGASTVVGFMRKLGQFSNAIVWLDEYKNDIGEKKIESLKNIWDRVGYERGVKDSSNRTQTTPVTSAAIISGQDIPNVEPALFSRTVLCEFRVMQRTQEQVDAFQALRKMEETGITNVTLEFLSFRDRIKEHFFTAYNEIAATFRRAFGQEDVIERQVINYAILVAAVRVVEEGGAKLPFTWIDLTIIAERYIKRQRDMMKQSNELQAFFEMVNFLLSSGEIQEGTDIHIFQGLLKIRLAKIVPLYREHARRQGIKPLDKGTLVNYLTTCDTYREIESKQSSHRFPNLTNPTSCVVFLHGAVKEKYGVDFGVKTELPENQAVPDSTGEDLPF